MTLDLQSLLKATLDAGGSDLHLSTGQPPLIRLRGRMLRSQAEPLVERFADALRALAVRVESGVFGARMEVELVNDGPVTSVLE